MIVAGEILSADSNFIIFLFLIEDAALKINTFRISTVSPAITALNISSFKIISINDSKDACKLSSPKNKISISSFEYLSCNSISSSLEKSKYAPLTPTLFFINILLFFIKNETQYLFLYLT